MSTADAVPTTNPSIALTKKGERAAIEGAPDRMTAVAEKRRLYTVAAREVERMLAFLDRLDGDPDLEANDDLEPSLAGLGVDFSGGDDRELDQSDDEPDSEGEPLLGAPESVATYSGPSYGGWEPEGVRRSREGRQTHWAKGNSSDLEGDAREDHEEGGDSEPSLGWEHPNRGFGIDQDGIGCSGTDDLEGDDADREDDGDGGGGSPTKACGKAQEAARRGTARTAAGFRQRRYAEGHARQRRQP